MKDVRKERKREVIERMGERRYKKGEERREKKG